MRFAGFFARLPLRFVSAAAVAGTLAAVSAPLHAQTAPQVLPYTMSTFAGPHATYAAGAACGAFVALDPQGDGCLASQVVVGTDPHDVRVDPFGNVYYIDDASVGLIHKINGQTLRQNIFVGSASQSKACASASDTLGTGCPANDGAANNNPAFYTTTTKLKTQRGLTVAPNGDVYSAGYNDYTIHRVSAATGILSIAAGTGTAATTATNGAVATTPIGSSRGVGVDAAGNVYIADTALNVLQLASGGQLTMLTAANPGGTKQVDNNVAASQALLSAPEDVQIDPYGNIIIGDAGNNALRAIYKGKGPFFGIPNPVVGNIYTLAGGLATGVSTAYTAGSNAPLPGTTVAVAPRKLGIDLAGNVYIADSSAQVVWFLDAQTGYIRVLAGTFGSAGSTAPTTCKGAGDTTLGDGCPAWQAGIFANADMGVSPDNQGNIYISDAQGGSSAAISRIRKVLSDLAFGSVNVGASVTQTIFLHFGPTDAQAPTNPFVVSGADYTVGTPTCKLNADTTTDCFVPLTFKPSHTGADNATLIVTSAKGTASSFVVSGTGAGASLAVDPGFLNSVTAAVKNPGQIATDGSGNSFLADTGNNRVLLINAAGTVSTLAGTGTPSFSGDNGAATAATLNAPAAVTYINGSVYIADTGNNRVRAVNLGSGVITTIAGGASAVCATAADTFGNACPGTSATLSKPSGLAASPNGVVFVSDTGNNQIRQIGTDGYITLLAGGSASCSSDPYGNGCAATGAIFSAPSGLAYDANSSSLLVADTGSNQVRKIYLGNAITIATAPNIASAVINPVSALAGNGQAGSSVDAGSSAVLSALNAPQGVAVDAAENVYIADTGNHAVRMVTPSGIISTVAGILGASGATPVPGAASDTQLSSPAGVAVLPGSSLLIVDSGNNRVLSDNRTAVTYNFGRINVGFSSSTHVFTEVSTGTANATLPSPLLTPSGNTTQFSLTAPSGSAGCTANQVLAAGATCALQAVFTPTAISTPSYAANYIETGVSSTNTPSITLTGVGAILTNTTSSIAQSSPATGNAQFGGSLALTVTVKPASCNNSAPSCFPTGTARIIIDGTAGSPLAVSGTGTATGTFSGLAVGSHTVTCSYSGDNYYAASSCANVSITVSPASTTSTLTVNKNSQPQFATTVLSVAVASNTSGIPIGTVVVTATDASGKVVGTYSNNGLNASGVATITMKQVIDPNTGYVTSDNTLPPGTYTLNCNYSGATNYAASACTPVTFTVVADAPALGIVVRGCAATATAPTVVSPPVEYGPCQPSHGSSNSLFETLINGVPAVTTAVGSTTDATLFITPTNSVSGPLTFSCSGLPAHSACTFAVLTQQGGNAGSSMQLTPGTAYVGPIPVDVTFWTDIQTSSSTTPNLRGNGNGIEFAMILGWPMAILGMGGLFLTRRKFRHIRFLTAIPLAMILFGGSMVSTGCAGPGNYTPQLTPAGQYPITITIQGGNITKTTTQVYFVVTQPGIQGIE